MGFFDKVLGNKQGENEAARYEDRARNGQPIRGEDSEAQQQADNASRLFWMGERRDNQTNRNRRNQRTPGPDYDDE